MADEPETPADAQEPAPPPEPDATLSLTAELLAGVWTLYALPANGERQALGAGPSGSGIMFPVKLLDRLVSEPS